jgi:hypothetical protein
MDAVELGQGDGVAVVGGAVKPFGRAPLVTLLVMDQRDLVGGAGVLALHCGFETNVVNTGSVYDCPVLGYGAI